MALCFRFSQIAVHDKKNETLGVLKADFEGPQSAKNKQ